MLRIIGASINQVGVVLSGLGRQNHTDSCIVWGFGRLRAAGDPSKRRGPRPPVDSKGSRPTEARPDPVLGGCTKIGQ